MKDNNISEEWRVIPSHPNYAASNLGHIKRLTAKTSGKANHILKSIDRGNGYLCITLKTNEKWRNFSIHRLVAETFLDGFKPELNVNHKNAIRSDNRVINLEIGTQSDNIRHSYQTGRQKKDQNSGANNGQAKLNNAQVFQIRNCSDRSKGYQSRFAKKFGVSTGVISDIINGKAWKSLL